MLTFFCLKSVHIHKGFLRFYINDIDLVLLASTPNKHRWRCGSYFFYSTCEDEMRQKVGKE